MSTVDVTVAVLSYNRPEYLPEALGSVLAQTVAPKDIVVLDNGSKPAVKESIQHLLGPGVRWDPAARPHGAAWNGRRALALGAKKSTKYLFIMFDDDRILPDFLEQQIGFLEQNPQVIFVSCNTAYMNKEGHRTGTLVNPPGALQPIELFTSSLEVAKLIARELAIPIHGAVYRTPPPPYSVPWRFRRLYGDIYHILHLPRFGTIAYQDKVLYELRLHGRQESALIRPRHQVQIFQVLRDLSRKDPALNAVFKSRQLNLVDENTQCLRKACRDCLSNTQGLCRVLCDEVALMLSAPRISIRYARHKLSSWLARRRK